MAHKTNSPDEHDELLHILGARSLIGMEFLRRIDTDDVENSETWLTELTFKRSQIHPQMHREIRLMRAAIHQLDAALADWRTGMADAAALAVAAATVLDAYAWDFSSWPRGVHSSRPGPP